MPSFYEEFISEAKANQYTQEEADKELSKALPDTLLNLRKSGLSHIDINDKFEKMGLPKTVWNPPPEAIARPQPAGQIQPQQEELISEEESKLNDVYDRVKNKKVKAMLLRQNPNIALVKRKIINNKIKDRAVKFTSEGFVPKGVGQIAREDVGFTRDTAESLVQAGKESAQFAGENVLKRSDIGTKFLIGSLSPEETVAQSRELVNLPEPEDQTFPEKVVRSTAELIPFLRRSAISGGTGFAAGAALGLAGAPVTAPTGAAIGLFVSSMQVEGGNAAVDLLEQGVDPEIVKPTAIVVGAVNGVLELATFKIFGKFISKTPIGKKIQKGAVDAVLKNPTARQAILKASKTLLQFSGAVAGEVSVEEAQEATNIIGEEVAKSIDAIKKGEEYQAPESKEIIDRLVEVGKKSVLGMGGLLAGGKIISTVARGAVAGAKEVISTKPVIKKEPIIKKPLPPPKVPSAESAQAAIIERQKAKFKGAEAAEPSIEKSKEKEKSLQFLEADKIIKEPKAPVAKPVISDVDNKQVREILESKKKEINVRSEKEAKEFTHEMIIRRRADIETNMLDSNYFVQNINKNITKKQREILPFILEKTDIPKALKRPDLEKDFETEKQNLEKISTQVKKHFDDGFKFMEKNIKNFSGQQLENYVTHLWDIPKNKVSTVTRWFTTRNPFLKKRFISTIKEGVEKFGLKPRTLDVSEIITIYDSARITAAANEKFVDDLKKLKIEGRPLLERSDKAPADWKPIDHPALRKNIFVPTGKLQEGQQVSPDLRIILRDMGIQIGRRVSKTQEITEGMSIFSDTKKEIRLKQFFKNKTLAHEIGHHIDQSMGLGKEFIKRHQSELLELNRERIELLEGTDFEDYANSTEEQIAELFAFMWTKPNIAMVKAPNAMAEVMEILLNDNVMKQLVDFDFENKAKSTIQEQVNLLIKSPVKVHPELKRHMEVVFGDTYDFGKVGNAVTTLNSFMKKGQLSLSLFHHFALSETSLGIFGPGGGAGLTKLPNVLGNIINDYFTGNPAAIKKSDIAKDGVRNGLVLGSLVDIPVAKIQRTLNDFAEKTKNIPLINKATKVGATFNEKWDRALWTYLHDGFKMYAYEHLVSQMPIDHKDPVGYKRTIAGFINDTFGGQNWDALLATPKMKQMSGLILLSPDWTLSTIKQALSPTGIGTGKGQIASVRRKQGAMFWIKSAFYYSILQNMANVAFRSKDRKDNPDKYPDGKFGMLDYTMLGNTFGHKTHLFAGRNEDGTERYLRFGKQFRELFELFYDFSATPPDTITKRILSTPKATIKRLGVKASPIVQWASAAIFGQTPAGWEVKNIKSAEDWEWAFEVAKHTGKTFLPFSTRKLLAEDGKFSPTDLFVPASKGMSEFKAKKLIKEGMFRLVEGNSPRLFVEAYNGAFANNHNAFEMSVKATKSLIRGEKETLKDILLAIDQTKKDLKTAKNRYRVMLEKKRRGLKTQEKVARDNINAYNRTLNSIVKNKDNIDLSTVQ